jgi:adenylylsulfate kinase
MKPYAVFIGRFQPFHNGHKWLFNQKLDKGIPILIMIRDMPPDDKNPFSAEESKWLISKVYTHNNNVEVMIIPNIESVNYGRGVGYEINEFTPPHDVGTISATQIREAIKLGDDSWKSIVDPMIHSDIEQRLR